MKANKTFLITAIVLIVIVLSGIGVYTKSHSLSQQEKGKTQNIVLSNGVMLSSDGVELVKYTGKEATDSLGVAKVEISNEGGTDVPMGAIDFEAKLANGKILSPDSNYSGFYFTSKPGDNTQRSLFFKIPKNEKIDKLIYHSDMKNKVELDVN